MTTAKKTPTTRTPEARTPASRTTIRPAQVARTLQDAAYVAVGLGVIGFQKAQARRQELGRQLAESRKDLQPRLAELAERVEPKVEQYRAKVGELAAKVGEMVGR